MSLLADIAHQADVPVEGVVRVVTRKSVSRSIQQRVVPVLNSLNADQLRALERLARAATPDVVPIGEEFATEDVRLPEPTLGSSLDLGESAAARTNGAGDMLTLQLGVLLEEVAASLSELRRGHQTDRQERVDDLAVLVDLMATGWRGVDRRLARVERALARMEAVADKPRSSTS